MQDVTKRPAFVTGGTDGVTKRTGRDVRPRDFA
jgi:hypothetical protein